MTPGTPAAPVKGIRRWAGRKCAAAAVLALVLLVAGGVWAYGVAQHGLAAYRAIQRVQTAAIGSCFGFSRGFGMNGEDVPHQ